MGTQPYNNLTGVVRFISRHSAVARRFARCARPVVALHRVRAAVLLAALELVAPAAAASPALFRAAGVPAAAGARLADDEQRTETGQTI